MRKEELEKSSPETVSASLFTEHPRFRRAGKSKELVESERVTAASVSSQKTLATDAKDTFLPCFFHKSLKSLERIGLKLGVEPGFFSPEFMGKKEKDGIDGNQSRHPTLTPANELLEFRFKAFLL